MHGHVDADRGRPATIGDLERLGDGIDRVIEAAEKRIVERVAELDTRVNGRLTRAERHIGKLGDRIVSLEGWRRSHTWFVRSVAVASHHPLLLAVAGSSVSAAITYLVTN